MRGGANHMRNRVPKLVGIQVPSDGFTVEEMELSKLIAENSVEGLYRKLPTSRMKYILAAHFELGYTQELIASVLGVTQEQVALEVENIRKVFLGKPYRPHKQKAKIAIEDLIGVLIQLQKV